MKKIILLFLISLNSIAVESEIKIGIYELAPHMIVQEGNLSGHVIDYINSEIKPNLEKNESISLIELPFSRIIDYLKNGKIDVAFMLSKNPIREKDFDYPEQSFFTTNSSLVFLKETKMKNLVNSSQLAKLTIAHTQGSILPPFISNSTAKIDWISGENVLQRNLERLKAKRIDAVFAPTQGHAKYIIQENKMDKYFDVIEVPNTQLDLYFVFRKDLPSKIKSIFTKNKKPSATYLKYYSISK